MSRPDVVIIMTDEERAIPPYESDDVFAWRRGTLSGRAWFDDHAVNFRRHYTGSLACVPIARRSSLASTPTCTTSPRPTASARWPRREMMQRLVAQKAPEN